MKIKTLSAAAAFPIAGFFTAAHSPAQAEIINFDIDFRTESSQCSSNRLIAGKWTATLPSSSTPTREYQFGVKEGAVYIENDFKAALDEIIGIEAAKSVIYSIIKSVEKEDCDKPNPSSAPLPPLKNRL